MREREYIAFPKEEAFRRLEAEFEFHPVIEYADLSNALGRVLAEDVYSKNTLPNKLSSRMDGIAVYYSYFENGMPDTSGWEEGCEYVFCNTGIGINGDYDTCIRIEEVQIEDGKLVLSKVPEKKGANTTAVGERLKEGDLLAKKGSVLSPLMLAHIVQGGYTHVKVYRRPVVAFIPSGGELVEPGKPLPSGKNVETNTYMMRGKILSWGAEPLIYPIQPDSTPVLTAVMEDALSKADIVILNGGSSKGSDDCAIDVIGSVGTILSHMIMSGPGAHTVCAVSNNGKPIIGIPGPSVGAECTTDWFLLPLIRKYFELPYEEKTVKAVYRGVELSIALKIKGFVGIRRARLTCDENGQLSVRAADNSNISDMDRAEGFLKVTSDPIHDGDLVDVELRWPYNVN